MRVVSDAGPASGRLDDGVHRLPLRIYYEDTDAGGIVYHANYLRYLERGRSELLRCLGIDHARAWSEGGAQGRIGFAVKHVEIDFRTPAVLDDALLIESTVAAVGAASVEARQTILRGAEVIASARVRVALVDIDGRPRRLPRLWKERLSGVMVRESGCSDSRAQ